jgi:hypothetical protein
MEWVLFNEGVETGMSVWSMDRMLWTVKSGVDATSLTLPVPPDEALEMLGDGPWAGQFEAYRVNEAGVVTHIVYTEPVLFE